MESDTLAISPNQVIKVGVTVKNTCLVWAVAISNDLYWALPANQRRVLLSFVNDKFVLQFGETGALFSASHSPKTRSWVQINHNHTTIFPATGTAVNSIPVNAIFDNASRQMVFDVPYFLSETALLAITRNPEEAMTFEPRRVRPRVMGQKLPTPDSKPVSTPVSKPDWSDDAVSQLLDAVRMMMQARPDIALTVEDRQLIARSVQEFNF